MYKTMLVFILLVGCIYLLRHLPRRVAIELDIRNNGDFQTINNPIYSRYLAERERDNRPG